MWLPEDHVECRRVVRPVVLGFYPASNPASNLASKPRVIKEGGNPSSYGSTAFHIPIALLAEVLFLARIVFRGWVGCVLVW